MIKEKRKSKKYTQEKMSQILGISLRQYIRIDNEEDLPRRDVLRNLIAELDLTNEEIGEYIRKREYRKSCVNRISFRLIT